MGDEGAVVYLRNGWVRRGVGHEESDAVYVGHHMYIRRVARCEGGGVAAFAALQRSPVEEHHGAEGGVAHFDVERGQDVVAVKGDDAHSARAFRDARQGELSVRDGCGYAACGGRRAQALFGGVRGGRGHGDDRSLAHVDEEGAVLVAVQSLCAVKIRRDAFCGHDRVGIGGDGHGDGVREGHAPVKGGVSRGDLALTGRKRVHHARGVHGSHVVVGREELRRRGGDVCGLECAREHKRGAREHIRGLLAACGESEVDVQSIDLAHFDVQDVGDVGVVRKRKGDVRLAGCKSRNPSVRTHAYDCGVGGRPHGSAVVHGGLCGGVYGACQGAFADEEVQFLFRLRAVKPDRDVGGRDVLYGVVAEVGEGGVEGVTEVIAGGCRGVAGQQRSDAKPHAHDDGRGEENVFCYGPFLCGIEFRSHGRKSITLYIRQPRFAI